MMEAMWTRFIPAVLEIQRLIHQEKVLGDIVRVFSDLSQDFPKDRKHRIYAPGQYARGVC
jgi:predicted dehydrogenase